MKFLEGLGLETGSSWLDFEFDLDTGFFYFRLL